MALVLANRVQETTTTTGTGTVTLAGAVNGYQSFAAIGNGNTTYYTITSGNAWEVGIGTYTSSGTTLSRDTVLASSASGSKITLSGTSNVFVTYPAERSVYSGNTAALSLPAPSTSGNVITSNGSAWTSAPLPVAYPQNIQSGNYTLVLSDAGKHIYSANTASQTITIPTNASVAFPIGTLFTIVNMGTSAIVLGVSGVSIFANGSTTPAAFPVVLPGGALQMLKTDTNSWKATFGTISQAEFLFLSVAGGGGGGGGTNSPGGVYGGGGGAGGLISSTKAIATGTLTVSVGGGGTRGGYSGGGGQGTSSSITGTTTAVGGGAGGGGGSIGGVGGSGGGGSSNAAGGNGTAGQGNAGAAGNGGGGGGAGNASSGGNGGNGLASTITGTSVAYAGGGGGGGGYAGGSGGGANGAVYGNNTPAAATANLGGGGAGGSWNGGAGGSGVVIISTPFPAASTTGSPTVTTAGGMTIYKFTSSGTITW